jgi:hypothetical protein
MEKKNYLDHLRKWKGVELKYELWYSCRKIDSENNPMVSGRQHSPGKMGVEVILRVSILLENI